MQGYIFSDNLLVGVLQRLKNLNSDCEHTLSLLNAQQQNQVTSLRELGFVSHAPQDSKLNGVGAEAPPRSEPVVTQSIIEQLDKFESNMRFLENQVNDAKFIGDALYRQFANPKDKQ